MDTMQIPSEPSLVHALRKHRGEVTCVDLIGARLATGGGDRTLRIWRWEPTTGWAEIAVAKGAHRYSITSARWSQGGSLLASAGVDGAARLWCGRTLSPRHALVAPGATAIRSLCWAGAGAGGGRLLAGHDDGSLCVWHVARGALLSRVAAHEGALHALCAPAGGALVLTACTHGVCKVFDLVEMCGEGGGHRAPLTWVDCVHDLGALCADASEDGTSVATGGHDALIRLWRVAEGARGVVEWGAPLEGHVAAVTALRWARGPPPCGYVLASASLDRTARLWAPESGACLHVVAAHNRYLTCIAISHDLRCLVTGSNDKSVKTWSLGSFTVDDELEPACAAAAHFGLGDLEGIGPVGGEESDAECPEGRAARGGKARRVWHADRAHSGPINCVAAHGGSIVTASSDGLVRVWRWSDDTEELGTEHTLDAHQYPVLAADFGAGGRLLLTAGLDGGAYLWDVDSGMQLRSLCVPTSGGTCSGGTGGGEAGGGGVRGGRVSGHRPPMLLLATDDGLAPLWSLASQDPRPMHVYGGHTEAVMCCAWSHDGRVAATGAASGELRVHLSPPAPNTLYHLSAAHDLGVLSCDFAPSSNGVQLPDDSHLLATAGCDSLLKLWIVESGSSEDGADCVSVRLVHQLEAHGGAVTCARWGVGEGPPASLLATAGDDGWARVWRVTDAGKEVVPVAAVAAVGAGRALAVAIMEQSVLVVGGGAGELTLWRLPDPAEALAEEEEGAAPRFWGEAGVGRWLREYISRAPGSTMTHEEELRLLERARDAGVTGPRLLDDPVEELVDDFGYGSDVGDMSGDEKGQLERAAARALIDHELRWLRRGPHPPALERVAPHGLLCPLSHRVMREPGRAADGFTYERANIIEWFLASESAESAVSPMSGRRVVNTHVQPNYALRDALRVFLEEHDHHADAELPP